MQSQTGTALLRLHRAIEIISLRNFARGFAGMSKEVITGLNISKGGSDPPLKPDEEYPDWLWRLAHPERTLGDLRRAERSTLGFEETRRLEKLENRDRIRNLNVIKSK